MIATIVAINRGSPPLPAIIFKETLQFRVCLAEVSLALRGRDLTVIAFEQKDDEIFEDVLSAQGFAYAIHIIINLQPGSIVWFWLCPDSTLRFGSGVLTEPHEWTNRSHVVYPMVA